MKNFKLASVFILSIFFTTFYSCENEPLDGFDFTNENSLLGTWTMASFNATVNTTTDFAGTIIESDFVIESENPNYDLTFLPSTFTTSGSYGYVANITVNGQTSTQNLSVDNVAGSGNYTTNGSEITTDGSFVSYEFQGMDLSDVAGEQTAPYTISADGQTLTFTQSTTQTDGANGATTNSTSVSTSVWTKVGSSNNTTCADATAFATTAETQYSADTSNENLCNAYKSALQNQITACGDANGELQSIIDGLGDCNQVNNITEDFYAEIDGVEFNYNFLNGYNLDATNTIIIDALETSTQEGIKITFPNNIVPGTYTPSDTPIIGNLWSYTGPNPMAGSSVINDSDSITLTISMHDTVNNVIEGNFDWDCTVNNNNGASTYIITNGYFLIEY